MRSGITSVPEPKGAWSSYGANCITPPGSGGISRLFMSPSAGSIEPASGAPGPADLMVIEPRYGTLKCSSLAPAGRLASAFASVAALLMIGVNDSMVAAISPFKRSPVRPATCSVLRLVESMSSASSRICSHLSPLLLPKYAKQRVSWLR